MLFRSELGRVDVSSVMIEHIDGTKKVYEISAKPDEQQDPVETDQRFSLF